MKQDENSKSTKAKARQVSGLRKESISAAEKQQGASLGNGWIKRYSSIGILESLAVLVYVGRKRFVLFAVFFGIVQRCFTGNILD